MKSKLKKSLSLLLALVMAMSCMSLGAFAEGDGTGYNGATLPASPNMSGEVIDVTAANAQYVLDGAYGDITDKTINFTENITDVLELARPTKYEGSGTTYLAYHLQGGLDSGEPRVWSADYLATITETSNRYYRTLSNVTFTANSGVTLAGFAFSAGHKYISTEKPVSVYDYVRDQNFAQPGSIYYQYSSLDNITFKGLTIVDGVLDFQLYMEDCTVSNITFDSCEIGGNETTGNVAAIHLLADNQYFTNITVEDCYLHGCYQGVYVQGVNGLTIQNNQVNTTTHNAFALQSYSNPVKGSVAIKENYVADAGDRAIRFGNIDADANITINNNVLLKSAAASEKETDVIKDVSGGNTATVVNLDNNYWNGVTAAEAVKGSFVAPTKVGVIAGTFPVDVSNYCADGYTAVNNGNDTWTVQASEHFYYRSADNAWHIADLEGLEMFRNSVNNGNSFKGQTVYLDAESITLSGSWTPIGNSKRITAQSVQGKDTVLTGAPYFAGTFNGQGHEIKGLTNGEYTPADTSLDADHNYVYGLFGTVGNGAVIENLNLTGVVIDTTGTENVKGDSVGALAGYSFGNVKIDKVSVSGSVKGLDAVGAIIGRVYQGKFNDTKTIELTNCSSDATVSGIEQNEIGSKVSGLFGYVTSHNKAGGTIYPVKVIMTGNRFTGDVSTGIYTSPIAVLGKLVFSKVDDSSFTPANYGDISNNTVNGAAATMELSGTVFYTSSNKPSVTGEMVLLQAAKVAEIEGVGQYETLAEAIENVTDNKTIKLLDNVTLSAKLVIDNGKRFTIDLNGKTLASSVARTFDLMHAYLTIVDSGETKGAIASMQPINVYGSKESTYTTAGSYNSLTLDGVTVKGTNGGTDDTATHSSVVLWYSAENSANAYGSLIDITNSTLFGNVWPLGSIKNSTSVVNLNAGTRIIRPATLQEGDKDKDGKTGIALAGNVEMNIADGVTVTALTPIEVRAGKLTINGGTFTSNASVGGYSVAPNGNGSTTYGAALAVSQHTTRQDIDVTVNGGTFTSNNVALSVSNPENGQSGEGTLTVSVPEGKNPTFTGGTSAVAVINGDERVLISLKGGTYSTDPSAAGESVVYDGTNSVLTKNYVADNYEAVKNGDNTWTVQPVAAETTFAGYEDTAVEEAVIEEALTGNDAAEIPPASNSDAASSGKTYVAYKVDNDTVVKTSLTVSVVSVTNTQSAQASVTDSEVATALVNAANTVNNMPSKSEVKVADLVKAKTLTGSDNEIKLGMSLTLTMQTSAKVTFDIHPTVQVKTGDNTGAVETLANEYIAKDGMTVKMPVPSTWTSVKVYHGNDSVGTFTPKTSGSVTYVEFKGTSFSEYSGEDNSANVSSAYGSIDGLQAMFGNANDLYIWFKVGENGNVQLDNGYSFSIRFNDAQVGAATHMRDVTPSANATAYLTSSKTACYVEYLEPKAVSSVNSAVKNGKNYGRYLIAIKAFAKFLDEPVYIGVNDAAGEPLTIASYTNANTTEYKTTQYDATFGYSIMNYASILQKYYSSDHPEFSGLCDAMTTFANYMKTLR